MNVLNWIVIILAGLVVCYTPSGDSFPHKETIAEKAIQSIDQEALLSFEITFVDDPPYKHKFLWFSENHLRIMLELKNISDSTYYVAKFAPSGDNGRPRFKIESENGKEIYPKRRRCVDYWYTKDMFIRLKPGEKYSEIVDWEEFVDYDLRRGKYYYIWAIYSSPHATEDWSRKYGINIWSGKIKSNRLKFRY